MSRKPVVKKKHKKLIIAASVVGGVLLAAASAIGGGLIYNAIKVHNLNSSNTAGSDFSGNHVFDNNGNDFEFDDSGQIVIDDQTEEERKILLNSLEGFILADANSRLEQPIDGVDNLLSINLLPSNLYGDDGSNTLDKYYLSILFSSNGKLYTLNYLTGKDFETKEEISKNLIADFVSYLSYNCALDNCAPLSELGQNIMDALGQNVVHVGADYLGFRESGDAFYLIPVYFSDGSATVYYASATALNKDNLLPMPQLLAELPTSDNKYFTLSQAIESAELQRIMDIYNNLKNPNQQAETQVDENLLN